MGCVRTFFVGFVALVAISFSPASGQEVRILVSKETTYVTEPVGADGRVDFLAAVDEKARAGVTPGNNAFAPIARAVGARIVDEPSRARFFDRLGSELPPEHGGMTSWQEFAAGRTDDDLGDQFDRASGSPWTDEECPAVAEWLDGNGAALEAISEASHRSRFYVPLAGDESISRNARWGLPWIREAARLLKARAMRRLGAGEDLSAWADLLACHRLARLAGTSPLPTYRLAGFALESVACHGEAVFAHHAEPSVEGFRQRRLELEGLGLPPAFSSVIDFSARLESLDLFQHFAIGEPGNHLAEYRFIWTMQEAVGGGRSRRALVESTLRQPIDWNEGLRSVNRWYDRFADAAGCETFEEQKAAFDAVERKIGSAVVDPAGEHAADGLSEAARNARILGAAFAEPGVTSWRMFAEARTRTAQRHDLSLVALALAEYRSRHGRYPDRLEDLVPGVLPELPMDRFTGDAIRYRSLGGGRQVRLYSVGVNGIDNKGKLGLGDDDVAANLPPDP